MAMFNAKNKIKIPIVFVRLAPPTRTTAKAGVGNLTMRFTIKKNTRLVNVVRVRVLLVCQRM